MFDVMAMWLAHGLFRQTRHGSRSVLPLRYGSPKVAEILYLSDQTSEANMDRRVCCGIRINQFGTV